MVTNRQHWAWGQISIKIIYQFKSHNRRGHRSWNNVKSSQSIHHCSIKKIRRASRRIKKKNRAPRKTTRVTGWLKIFKHTRSSNLPSQISGGQIPSIPFKYINFQIIKQRNRGNCQSIPTFKKKFKKYHKNH